MVVLRQWAICITASSLVGAVVYALAPKGNIQKAMKVVISIFFICAILSPFLAGKKISFKDDIEKVSISKYKENSVNKKINSNINNEMLKASKNLIEQQTKSILYSQQIYNGQIHANMDIDKKGSIFIKTIEINLTSKDMLKKNKIIKLISSSFKLENRLIKVTELKESDD